MCDQPNMSMPDRLRIAAAPARQPRVPLGHPLIQCFGASTKRGRADTAGSRHQGDASRPMHSSAWTQQSVEFGGFAAKIGAMRFKPLP